MKLAMVRVAGGFALADAESAKKAERYKVGEQVMATVVKPRSNRFQRKFFALLRVGYDYWEPAEGQEAVNFRGHVPEKDFERFREEVTIMAGFYDAVWNIRGELRLQAKSIAFGEMEPEEFDRLYSASIDVLMRMVLSAKGFDRATLDQTVDHILRFG